MRARFVVVGLVALCAGAGVLPLLPAVASAGEGCANEALREVQGSAYLPDCRAYEMVSPPEKLGADVVAMSSRTRAAAGESPGLPAAVEFSSLGGFGDVHGTGISTEYLAQRDRTPGTSGWSSHGIVPQQNPTTLLGLLGGQEPGYKADMSPDLTKGVFWASTPLTDAPNVAHVPNLYLREDLRTPGEGSYRLLTDSFSELPAPVFGVDIRELVAGTSSDFRHVLFESRQDLTAGATGTNAKLYKSDDGVVRLVSAGPSCPGSRGTRAQTPCSIAGQGELETHYTQRTLSTDGSRAIFTSPVETPPGAPFATSGAASKLFQLDDRGTPSTADDALVQLDASEAAVPGPTRMAYYETASADGSRVFFLSDEQLTEAPGGGLYMWERQPTDETQSVTVDASGGTFTLTAHSQPSHGLGTLTEGSTEVENVEGSFSAGQTISGTGIPAGTTIVAIPSSETLTLSAAATVSESVGLNASMDATTAPLPSSATVAQVQAALEALSNVGTGNVTVSGGPGGAGGSTPYLVTFTGGLAGVDVMRMSADGSALSGGAASATVAVTTPVRNLTLLAVTSPNPVGSGVLGASADGHRLYFVTDDKQLVPGAPPVTQAAIYYWQDADGTPGGTLSFVGDVAGNDLPTNDNYALWNGAPKTARVTPDGRYLAFEVSDGSGLAQKYDQSQCLGGSAGNPNITGNGCSEVYVYRADGSSLTAPDLVCASCNPSGAPASASAWIDITSSSASATAFTTHLAHALSDDGRYVFFSTLEGLVSQDTNGKFDAYEYDTTTGQVHLLSSGTDPYDSYFLDASADGHDVYFVTRRRLVGWDTDTANDMYDARVEGGFAEPAKVSNCAGDGCQGAPGAPPAALVAPGSVSLVGAGNLAAGQPQTHPSPAALRKQRLARALRACHRRRGRVRKRCEASAHKRYGSAARNGRAER